MITKVVYGDISNIDSLIQDEITNNKFTDVIAIFSHQGYIVAVLSK